MPTQLRKLNLDRVDLVPAGANPGAHIVLAKADTVSNAAGTVTNASGGFVTTTGTAAPYTPPYTSGSITLDPLNKMTFDEVQRAKDLQEMLEEVCKYTFDLQDAVFSSLYNSANPKNDILTSIDQFKQAVDEALANWTQGKPVDKAKIDLIKAHLTELRDTLEKEKPVEKEIQKTEEQPPVVTGIPADVQKALDDQKVQIEKLLADNAAQAERIAKAEADARVEKERRERLEYVKKAETEIPNLPGTPDEKGALLHKVYAALDPKDADAVLALLKAGDASQKTLVMGEIGKSTADTSDTALGELTVKAEEIAKAEPRLTKQQAFKKACDQNPDLFDRHRKESRRTVTN